MSSLPAPFSNKIIGGCGGGGGGAGKEGKKELSEGKRTRWGIKVMRKTTRGFIKLRERSLEKGGKRFEKGKQSKRPVLGTHSRLLKVKNP